MKKVLVIADKHVGSIYGLNLPEYLSPQIRNSSDCMMLHDCFNEVRDWVGKLDYVFDLGDACDGWNPKQHGDERTQEEDRQVEANVKLMRTLRGSPEIRVVDGSGYHIGSRKLDEKYAQAVGAIKHPKYGFYAWPDQTVKIEDVNFHFCHFINVTKSVWIYRTTPLAKELLLALAIDNPAQIVLRGHSHYFVYVGFSEHFSMSCPGFQTQTSFMAKTAPFSSKPKWGAILFTVNGDSWDWDKKLWEANVRKEIFRGGKG